MARPRSTNACSKPRKIPRSDVRMLDCEFTVLEGPHARRKFWQMFTVQGGKVDENGVSIAWKISKSTFRAMIDSALGLDPQDMSEAAKQKRILRGLADLTDITFVAKIKVEPSEDTRYGDQNRLDRVVLPTEKEWKLVMDGKDVPASPSRSRGAGQGRGRAARLDQNAARARSPGRPQARPPQTSGAPAWSPAIVRCCSARGEAARACLAQRVSHDRRRVADARRRMKRRRRSANGSKEEEGSISQSAV